MYAFTIVILLIFNADHVDFFLHLCESATFVASSLLVVASTTANAVW